MFGCTWWSKTTESAMSQWFKPIPDGDWNQSQTELIPPSNHTKLLPGAHDVLLQSLDFCIMVVSSKLAITHEWFCFTGWLTTFPTAKQWLSWDLMLRRSLLNFRKWVQDIFPKGTSKPWCSASGFSEITYCLWCISENSRTCSEKGKEI